MSYLELGTIVNTHGLNGEVRVLCNYYGNNFPWTVNTTIYLDQEPDLLPLVIINIRHHKNFLLLTFKDYNKIALVELMKTKKIVINTKTFSNDNLSWYYEDIINFQAFDANNNELLGQVISFLDNNHQGLWEIKMLDQVFFIPNNKYFIAKIDKIQKKVYFNIIEGLIKND